MLGAVGQTPDEEVPALFEERQKREDDLSRMLLSPLFVLTQGLSTQPQSESCVPSAIEDRSRLGLSE